MRASAIFVTFCIKNLIQGVEIETYILKYVVVEFAIDTDIW